MRRVLTRVVLPALAIAAVAWSSGEIRRDRRRQLRLFGERHAVRRRAAKGYFKEEGANVTGIISSAGGGTSVRNAMARRRLRRSQSRRDRGRDPAGRRPQDRQRQRADHRRVRLAGEEGLADQDHQGPQGQEDRLHQSALDQPGARHPDAAEGRAQARGRRAGEDRRLRPDGRRARARPDRRRAGDRAAVVEEQGQVPRADHRRRSAAAARQRRRRRDRRRPTKTRGDFIRAVIRARRRGGRVHERAIRTRPATSSPSHSTSRRRWRAARCATSPPA